jgi:hypothetical protein
VKRRLDRAYELFVKGEVGYIVTTGRYSKRVGVASDVSGPKTEAEVGKKYLRDKFRISEDCILYENQSYDTIGNAWFAKKVCLEPHNITSCRIITSDYHMERSVLIFRWVLGPKYTVDREPIESQLEEDARKQRSRLEDTFIGYIRTHLLGSIPPGDDERIREFMEKEHLRYCLSDRSEAMLNALMDTAVIKAGYKNA